MIGLNEAPQTILSVVMIIFAVLLIALQIERRTKTYLTMSNTDKRLWIAELLTVICLVALVIVIIALYWHYIPADSPGCIPYISSFGVIASGVDPHTFALDPKAIPIPALTYTAAVAAYKSSANGFTTGYFAWDGVSVTILQSRAHQLVSGAPPGNSWVFQDLSTAAAR